MVIFERPRPLLHGARPSSPRHGAGPSPPTETRSMSYHTVSSHFKHGACCRHPFLVCGYRWTMCFLADRLRKYDSKLDTEEKGYVEIEDLLTNSTESHPVQASNGLNISKSLYIMLNYNRLYDHIAQLLCWSSVLHMWLTKLWSFSICLIWVQYGSDSLCHMAILWLYLVGEYHEWSSEKCFAHGRALIKKLLHYKIICVYFTQCQYIVLIAPWNGKIKV